MSRLKSRVFTGEREEKVVVAGVELELVLILMAHRQNHTLDVAPKHANPINRFLRLFGLPKSVACS